MADTSKIKDVDIPEYYTINYLEMSDGSKLRNLSYYPENPKGHVFMFPGMNTLVLSWINILTGLSEEGYRVEYVESREKYSSKLVKNAPITKERMLKDCVEAIEILDLEKEEYIAIGSSLGSNTLIHCMSTDEIHPKHALLVGPSPRLSVPLGMRLALPVVTYWTYEKIGLPIIKRVILRKFTNEDADPKQKHKYSLALDLADPVKLKKAVSTWHGHEIWDRLEYIDGSKSTCYLIGASEDRLHPDDDTKKVADMIDGAKYIDLKTNTAAHEQPLIDLINDL